jgi:hypothetical protein
MKGIVFIFLFLAAIAGETRAAIVYLKEGGRLEGTVVSYTDQAVELDTTQGRVRIAADRVKSVDYGQAKPAPSAPPPAAERWERPRRARPEEPLFDPPQQALSIDFGLAAPLNDVNFSAIGGGSASNGDVGPLIGFQYLYFTSPRVGWGGEFHYCARSTTDSPGLLASSDSHVFGDTLLLLGVMKYSLVERGSVRPYVLLGAGAHRTSTTIDARPMPGFAWSDTQTDERRRLVDDSATGFAGSARLGLDFGFADPGVFALEIGWTALGSASYGATPQGQALGLSQVRGPLNYFTFAGRWGWSF